MGLTTVLKATKRAPGSSNAAGRLRAQGQLPAVFYGPGQDGALTLALDYKEMKNAFLGSEGNRSLYTLDIEGQGRQPVILKDYQVDPLSRKMIHADFYKVDPTKPVIVRVPLVLTGKPVGVEKGGQLVQGEREIAISALPDQVPATLEVNVAKLNLGHAMHFSDIVAPEGIKLSYHTNLAVATVNIPKGLKAEAEAEAAAAAGDAKAAAAPAKKK